MEEIKNERYSKPNKHDNTRNVKHMGYIQKYNILGTNFLSFAITLLVLHVLVKLMITTNKIKVDTGGKKK